MNDERRSEKRLTEEELDALSARVKERIMDEIYGEVGRAVLKRSLQVLIVGVAALGAYLTGKGLK